MREEDRELRNKDQRGRGIERKKIEEKVEREIGVKDQGGIKRIGNNRREEGMDRSIEQKTAGSQSSSTFLLYRRLDQTPAGLY